MAISLFIVAVAACAVIFVLLGGYDVAADKPHSPAAHAALELLRERSIAVRAAGITPPDLTDPQLARTGAGNYESMCSGCHLRPGLEENELSVGLYPRPPSWRELAVADPREAFWAIKHGIKMTAMPAWGTSMENRYIWSVVAFLGRLRDMNEAQYVAMVAASSGHSHGGGETDVQAESGQRGECGRSSFEPLDDSTAGSDGNTGHDSHEHPHRSLYCSARQRRSQDPGSAETMRRA